MEAVRVSGVKTRPFWPTLTSWMVDEDEDEDEDEDGAGTEEEVVVAGEGPYWAEMVGKREERRMSRKVKKVDFAADIVILIGI
jgi:hypothetical protein